MIRIVVIDSRNGTRLREETTAAMQMATHVIIIDVDRVRVLRGEVDSDIPATATFHTAVSEAELSSDKARKDVAVREAKKDRTDDAEGDDPLAKARRVFPQEG